MISQDLKNNQNIKCNNDLDCSHSRNTEKNGTIEEISSRPNSGTTKTLTSKATSMFSNDK